MDKISNPIETIIEFAWATGADRFWVNNAKDELKKLRKKIEEYENGSSGVCKTLD
jgi:hypothetical protein